MDLMMSTAPFPTSLSHSPSSLEHLSAWLKDRSFSKATCHIQSINPQPYRQSSTAISLSQMDRTLHYWPDDHTIQAETGQTWQAFVQQLAPYSQGLPLLYPSHWSLSDILGADWPSVTTGLAGRYPRDMVLGLSTLDTQGTLTKAGGRVMKNVSGYDLCRLMVGNHHSLGLITDVTLKLITYPNAFFGYWFTVSTHEEGLSLSQFLLAHHKPLLWACEIVTTRDSQPHDTTQVWVMATEPLPKNIQGHCATQTCVNDQALEESAQLSAFGWETDCRNTTGGSPSAVLSGALAVSLSQEAIATQRLITLFQQRDLTYRLHTRPAAGLLLFSVRFNQENNSSDYASLLNDLQQAFPELNTAPKQASLRITHWPASLSSLVNILHLPVLHTPEALWAQRLKAAYDPNHSLLSPHLPLHLLEHAS